MKLKDVKLNDHFEGTLLCSNVVSGKTVNGEPYLSLTLQDNTKTLPCKLWSAKQEIIDMVKAGEAYDCVVEINSYKNSVQGKVLSISKAASYDINELIMSSPFSKDELSDYISKCVNTIENDNLQKIVCSLLNECGGDFYEYQAASKIHHAYVGGLATHTYEMLKLGVEVCKIFEEVSYDYLISGIIIHDIGKINEYQKPTVGDFSSEGKLLGHISILDAKIYENAKKLGIEDSEEIMVLRHMILSHHGKKEFGSPVLPSTMEAVVLNLIDDLDSKINLISKELSDVKEGEFSGKVFALNDIQLYKHK